LFRSHLINRKIVTRSPEEIRGGGLLRYCNLLTRDFVVDEPADVQKLQSTVSTFLILKKILKQKKISKNFKKICKKFLKNFMTSDVLEVLHRLSRYRDANEENKKLLGSAF